MSGRLNFLLGKRGAPTGLCSGIVLTLGIDSELQLFSMFSELPFWLLLFLFAAVVGVIATLLIVRPDFSGKQSNHTQAPCEEVRIFIAVFIHPFPSGELEPFEQAVMLKSIYSKMDGIVRLFRGEVYRYQGNRLIVSWPMEKGLEKKRAFECYLNMRNELERERSYYKHSFGIHPEIKAGLHYGRVMAFRPAVSWPVLYLGSAVEITERIQHSCFHFRVSFVASSGIMKLMGIMEQPLGNLPIGEKNDSLSLCTLVDNRG